MCGWPPSRRVPRRVSDIVVIRSDEYTVDSPRFKAFVRGFVDDARDQRARGRPDVPRRRERRARLAGPARDDRPGGAVRRRRDGRPGRQGRGGRRGRRVRGLRDGHGDARSRLQPPLAGGPGERGAQVRSARRADRPAARIRRRRRRAGAVADGDGRDRGRARADGARRAGVRALGLRDQHAHGHGARPRDRLLAVRRLPLSRRAQPGERRARRDRGVGSDREPRGALQRHGLRDRDVRDAARPEHDHAQPRGRGDPRRDRLRRRRAHAPAGGAGPARGQGQRAPDPDRRAPGAARHRTRKGGSGARSCAACCAARC